jgi:hypothetical protein
LNPKFEKEFSKYPVEARRSALVDKIVNAYRNDLFLTCKDLLEYKDITRYTHGSIINALEAPTKRKLICVPRGCFKSSIGVVGYSIWSLIRNPNLRILIDSEIYENSKNFIREIRGKLELPRMTTLFGSFESNQWSEGSITIAQRTKIFKESSVTASGVNTGKTGQHFDIIIMDDLNSPKNSETPEQRQKVINHYKMNTSILEPDGTMVVIGTRYSSDDCIGFIMENEIYPKGLISS